MVFAAMGVPPGVNTIWRVDFYAKNKKKVHINIIKSGNDLLKLVFVFIYTRFLRIKSSTIFIKDITAFTGYLTKLFYAKPIKVCYSTSIFLDGRIFSQKTTKDTVFRLVLFNVSGQKPYKTIKFTH